MVFSLVVARDPADRIDDPRSLTAKCLIRPDESACKSGPIDGPASELTADVRWLRGA
jgi:hypothetical protein